MYTGVADHALTAELVSLVDVPVIASGDIVSRAKAQAVLATTGAEAVMVGRGAQGNPWLLREIIGRRAARADARGGRRGARALHPRDRPRARRAARVRLPEEVLRLVPRPRPLPAPVQAGARRARLDRGGRAAPDRGRAGRAAAARAARGRAPERATRSCSTCRSRSTAAARAPFAARSRCCGERPSYRRATDRDSGRVSALRARPAGAPRA